MYTIFSFQEINALAESARFYLGLRSLVIGSRTSLSEIQKRKDISKALYAMKQTLFKVNDRSTRDQLKLLMKKLKQNYNEERRASGSEVEEEGELAKGLRETVELFDDSEKKWKEENVLRKQKVEFDTSQTKELRLNLLETFVVKQKSGQAKKVQVKNQKRVILQMI